MLTVSLLLTLGCTSAPEPESDAAAAKPVAETVEPIPESSDPNGIEPMDVAALKALIESPHPRHRVVNFWATWCGPCIEELPRFRDWARGQDRADLVLVNVDLAQVRERLVQRHCAPGVRAREHEEGRALVARVARARVARALVRAVLLAELIHLVALRVGQPARFVPRRRRVRRNRVGGGVGRERRARAGRGARRAEGLHRLLGGGGASTTGDSADKDLRQSELEETEVKLD